jgi:glucosylglycerate synthase
MTMATADSISNISAPSTPSAPGLLVLLANMPPEQLEAVLANLTSHYPPEGLIVATADAIPTDSWPSLRIVPLPAPGGSWTLTANDFMNAHQLAGEHAARAILVLGPGAASLHPGALGELSNAILAANTDLAIPCYDLPPHAGLVNSAILYPLTRALFPSPARFPLAIDLGLSLRMAERLAGAAQRFTSLNQGDALLWPLNEAAVAGFTVNEFPVGQREIPQPSESDINAILASVTGSLFADIEAKATFWQRPRHFPLARSPMPQTQTADAAPDISSMLDAFQLAFANLQEIWALVLPPNSLLGLKRLSVTNAQSFRMPDALWARIVYDFLLAYRLRTINRGHLLGALIPLYLAWVASHFNITASGTDPERHIGALAAAFDAEKPYLVSRWRWPDRFNP